MPGLPLFALLLLLLPPSGEPLAVKRGRPPSSRRPSAAPKAQRSTAQQQEAANPAASGTALRSIARRGWSAGRQHARATAGASSAAAARWPAGRSSVSSARPTVFSTARRAPWERSVPRMCETPPGSSTVAGRPARPWPGGSRSTAFAGPGGRALLASDSKYGAQKQISAADGSSKEREAIEKLKKVVGAAGRLHPQWQSVVSPPVGRHSLGSCAVVGLSSRLVGSCLGKAIDAHDTVFRFGAAPVKGWEVDVGHRKSVQLVRKPSESKCSNIDHDVWFKGSNEQMRNESAADKRRPDKFYLVLGESAEKCKQRDRVSSFKGTPVKYLNSYKEVIVPGSDGLYATFLTSRERQTNKDKRLKATSGFNFVLALLISQACRRVDLYGFGKGEGGHYFFHEPETVKKPVENREGMKNVHNVGLENWLLQRAMAAKLLCIYDKRDLSFGATC